MKFEFDHRTGMMRPKKDEEIYFAQSQGGGLIVDDKKNNVKYIIERDGRITKLFGSFDKDNLNLYDMRDARIIADRVRRLLGVNHKYTDFHYFLRGYHMNESVIESCSDFLDESIWGDLARRSGGVQVRAEDVIDIDNETFKYEIKQLYKEQGEGDTLDVSSLRKFKCDDFSGLFHNFDKVKQIIGLDTWNVSDVTNMYFMFKSCSSLKELNIDNWDVSKVTDMSGMFEHCGSLTELNISNWDVSNVTNMGYMFNDCQNLTELNISNWNVSNVTDMYFMFECCSSLKELNIDNWDVSNVTDMSGMFNDCDKLITPKWYKI